jgi:hypothetical protein
VVLPQPKLPPFLTIVEGRKPKNKAHLTEQYAKSSIRESCYGWYPDTNAAHRAAQVYELDDGEWKLKWDIPKGTPKSELPWL